VPWPRLPAGYGSNKPLSRNRVNPRDAWGGLKSFKSSSRIRSALIQFDFGCVGLNRGKGFRLDLEVEFARQNHSHDWLAG